MSGSRKVLHYACSVDYERRTGGFVYNERILTGLAARGWRIERIDLPAGFPHPDAATVAEAAGRLAAIPDGSIVLLDQICITPMPDVAREIAARARLGIIVHHPTALDAADAQAAGRIAANELTALSHAGLVVVSSAATATTLEHDYGVSDRRIVIAEPGTERGPVFDHTGDASLTLLSVGAVVPRKDHATLIEALAGLTDLDWTLTIVGNETRAPEHAAAVRRQADETGIGKRITLAGEVEQAALDDLWSKAALYVASSRHEGYGMAIAEALARGIPVVTTGGGAVASWLDPAAARIVPPGDAAALGAALREIMGDRRAYAALRAGAVRARDRLPTWEAAVETVEAALLGLATDASVLAGRRGPGL